MKRFGKNKSKKADVIVISEPKDLRAFWPYEYSKNSNEPIPYFDPAYYLEQNSDVAAAGISALEHYACNGVFEERYGSKKLEEVIFKLNKIFGIDGGFKLLHLYMPSVFLTSISSSIIKRVLHKFIQYAFYRPYYELQVSQEFTNDETAIAHFFESGLSEGISPTPLFEPNYYRKQVENTFGTAPLKDKHLFMHWLLIGRFFKLSCSAIFNSEVYLSLNADLKKANNLVPIDHFLCHGAKENRRFCYHFQSDFYNRTYKLPIRTPAILHYLSFDEQNREFHPDIRIQSLSITDSKSSLLHEYIAFDTAEAQYIESNELKEIFKRAEKIEPAINNKTVNREIIIPGLRHAGNRLFQSALSLQELLSSNRYKIVITIPHCRMSGAARVASYLCHALAKIYSPSDILLLRTDGSEMLKPEWFPESVESFNFFEHIQTQGYDSKQKLLIDLLRGVKCQHFFNVNSRLGWNVIEGFGNQLKEFMCLHSYFFCKDRNIEGKQVGYPDMFFCSTFPFLTNIFVDSNYLRDSLIEQHSLKGKFCNKIVTLHSPCDNNDISFCQAETRLQITMNSQESKKIAFWAGRLDRQKRFDIVIEIAKEMPDLEICFWGKAVLDKVNYLDNLPPNMKFMGEYENFSELPFLHCDLWLYTSEWDGIPTILLDIIAYGIPLVASYVEGIKDLIQEDNAWPVMDYLNSSAYVEQINLLLSSPKLVLEKSQALKEHVRNSHNKDLYLNTLEGAINE